MEPLKKFMAEQMLYKKYHFKCECLMPLDFEGVIKDYRISNHQIIFIVESRGKLIEVDENHPNMTIERSV